MKQTTLEEVSAGGVVYRKTQDKLEFLIGKHSGYHKWVLPKGLVEKGESREEAAVREVEEEVGVVAKITEISPIKIIEYYYFADLETIRGKDAKGETSERRVKNYQEAPDFAKATTGKGVVHTRIHKQVIFYLMELESDLGKEGWEMEERRWVTYDEGMQLLAFETEREVFEKAREALGF